MGGGEASCFGVRRASELRESVDCRVDWTPLITSERRFSLLVASIEGRVEGIGLRVAKLDGLAAPDPDAGEPGARAVTLRCGDPSVNDRAEESRRIPVSRRLARLSDKGRSSSSSSTTFELGRRTFLRKAAALTRGAASIEPAALGGRGRCGDDMGKESFLCCCS